MKVTAQIKQRIEAKLREGLTTVENHYHRKLAMPRVTYELRGGTAGRADYIAWEVKINAVLLMENVDDFIINTVPHELAHLVTDKIYPEAHKTAVVYRRGRLRRTKREVHGTRWQEIMRVLGAPDASRCHQYDVTNVKRRKAGYQYRCTGCDKTVHLGPKRHARLQRDPQAIWHRGCKSSPLVLVGHQAAQPAPAYVKRTPGTRPTTGQTKQVRAYALYQELKHQYDRDGIIARFKRDLAMTQAGASTYYYNCQKMANQGV